MLKKNIALPQSIVGIDEQGQAPHGRTRDLQMFCLGTVSLSLSLNPNL